jgi:hypothetical protein
VHGLSQILLRPSYSRKQSKQSFVVPDRADRQLPGVLARSVPTLASHSRNPFSCYCPDGAAAVFSGAAFSGVAPSLVRNGKNGVTSNGIFSAAEVTATGLVLINSN